MSWRAKKRGREGRSGEDLATAMKIAKDKNLPILSIDLVKNKVSNTRFKLGNT